MPMAILNKNPKTGYWTEAEEFGRLMFVHSPSDCEGRGCAIHDHPSDHPLKDAPMNWREDRNILERICEHGIGHDDYDSVVYLRSIGSRDAGYHGCDGCCG